MPSDSLDLHFAVHDLHHARYSYQHDYVPLDDSWLGYDYCDLAASLLFVGC